MREECEEVHGLPGYLLEDLSVSMKRDWNKRATHNAKWFINTVRSNQSESEFDLTGEREVEWLVRTDLEILTSGRAPGSLRILEIGCGIGRMTRFLAGIFGEVHAVDVSGQMITRAKCRLGGLSNVFFQETNGTDFRSFPADFFDFIFCAYVFQHVPHKAVIRSNLEDAYRVLKPGGIFKFQTNGVNNPAFNQTSKDTWVGDTFPEPDIRSLSRQVGAGLLSLTGAGTQYCWAVWRKPDMNSHISMEARRPRILAARQQGGSRDAEALDHLIILVDHLDFNSVDTNVLNVRVNGMDLVPFYAGPVRQLFSKAKTGIEEIHSGGGTAQIEAILPQEVETGTVEASLFLRGKEIAGRVTVDLKEPRSRKPRIVSITNAADGGLDIYLHGSKSNVRIFLEGPVEPHQTEVQVLLGEYAIQASLPAFVPGNGFYMVQISIPAGVECGPIPVRVKIGDFVSGEEMVCLQKGADPAESFGHKSIKRVLKILSRFCPGKR